MDENGRPLFGLGALRRRPKQTSVTDADGGSIPTPITIGERSQPLTQLQKLHEQQSSSSSITHKGTKTLVVRFLLLKLSFFYNSFLNSFKFLFQYLKIKNKQKVK